MELLSSLLAVTLLVGCGQSTQEHFFPTAGIDDSGVGKSTQTAGVSELAPVQRSRIASDASRGLPNVWHQCPPGEVGWPNCHDPTPAPAPPITVFKMPSDISIGRSTAGYSLTFSYASGTHLTVTSPDGDNWVVPMRSGGFTYWTVELIRDAQNNVSIIGKRTAQPYSVNDPRRGSGPFTVRGGPEAESPAFCEASKALYSALGAYFGGIAGANLGIVGGAVGFGIGAIVGAPLGPVGEFIGTYLGAAAGGSAATAIGTGLGASVGVFLAQSGCAGSNGERAMNPLPGYNRGNSTSSPYDDGSQYTFPGSISETPPVQPCIYTWTRVYNTDGSEVINYDKPYCGG